jgi:FAD:protein FMN transferase
MPDDDPGIPPAPSEVEAPVPSAAEGPAHGPDESDPPASSASRGAKYILLIVGIAVISAGLWFAGGAGRQPLDHEHKSGPFLDAEAEIHLILPAGQKEQARQALRQAEAAFRDADARFSAAREDSEIRRFNAARAGEAVPLSPPAIEALCAARRLGEETLGAFDVTTAPLAALWKKAVADQRVPSPADLAAARAASTWDLIELADASALKLADSAGVDMAGLAQAMAVDRAAETLAGLGGKGGAAILGAALRCFGRREDGRPWNVDVPDPFAVGEPRSLMTLSITDAAVATVAPYRAFEVIAGRSYSRVIDPATGWPAGGAASATVVAPTCAQAHAWAVAICSLGEAALQTLPAGVEAIVVTGSPASHKIRVSDGLARFKAARE